MTLSEEQHGAPTPLRAICRFDVFAEHIWQDHFAERNPEDIAKGDGIWRAKVVAARRFEGDFLLRPPDISCPVVRRRRDTM